MWEYRQTVSVFNFGELKRHFFVLCEANTCRWHSLCVITWHVIAPVNMDLLPTLCPAVEESVFSRSLSGNALVVSADVGSQFTRSTFPLQSQRARLGEKIQNLTSVRTRTVTFPLQLHHPRSARGEAANTKTTGGGCLLRHTQPETHTAAQQVTGTPADLFTGCQVCTKLRIYESASVQFISWSWIDWNVVTMEK